jgi:dihydroorotate dehydrogenase (fumarate)
MNLSTSYLGLPLKNPLVAGASPLSAKLDSCRRMEDAGAAAIVMHSLFEEQLTRQQLAEFAHTEYHSESFSEATSYFPDRDDYALGPDRYLEHIANVKAACDVPVIGSLNGISTGGWIEHARLIEQAGADALELNVYFVATDPTESGSQVERRVFEIVSAVREIIAIPISVKLSQNYSSPAHFACQLGSLGANGVVLFNRFYQPDIDIEELDVAHRLDLSTSTELRLRLRWAAILYGHLTGDIALSGGVHTVEDCIKALMAGATVVQLASLLLKRGPEEIRKLADGVTAWLIDHEYESLDQLRGSMSHQHCPDPAAYERGNYLKTLQLWNV